MLTEPTTTPSFAARLKEQRRRLNINQIEAAGLLGISRRTLELWEMGRHPHILEITQEGALTRLQIFPPQPKKKRKKPVDNSAVTQQ